MNLSSKCVCEYVENYKWLCVLGLHLCEQKIHSWSNNKQHYCLGHLEVLSKNITHQFKADCINNLVGLIKLVFFDSTYCMYRIILIVYL